MIVTRFAPSPTGRLHLGHAYSALLGHQRVQVDGGQFLVRIEDLDQTRSRPEFVETIFEDLRWLGLDWAEPVLVQSERRAAYDYFMLVCGPLSVEQQARSPEGAASEIGDNGGLLKAAP